MSEMSNCCGATLDDFGFCASCHEHAVAEAFDDMMGNPLEKIDILVDQAKNINKQGLHENK